MISVADYIGPHAGCKDFGSLEEANANELLDAVNELLIEAEAAGVALEMNPQTETLISGVSYGGFRPQQCPQGAPGSAHKSGEAVDVYDPHGWLDRWLTDLMLEKHGLYREHPEATPSWAHLTTRAPSSGKRTFRP